MKLSQDALTPSSGKNSQSGGFLLKSPAEKIEGPNQSERQEQFSPNSPDRSQYVSDSYEDSIDRYLGFKAKKEDQVIGYK
jgi:hypothetical protein